jgi:hypothetical protein
MDAERVGGGDHLAYGGVFERPGPDPFVLVLGKVPRLMRATSALE